MFKVVKSGLLTMVDENKLEPTRVRTNGAPEEGRCFFRLEDCVAATKGKVTPYLLADGDIQVHACKKCHDSLTTSRKWIEQSPRSLKSEVFK